MNESVRTNRRFLGAGMAAILAAAGCAQPDPEAPATTAPPVVAAAGSELCLGRYLLTVPESGRVIGREQSMSGLGVRVRDIPAGTTLRDVPRHAPWLATTDADARIGPGITPVDAETVLLTWRASNRNHAIVDTEAVRLLPGLLVAAHGRTDGSAGIAEQRQAALALLRATTPRVTADAPAGSFCIDRALIQRGFDREEFAGVAMETGPDRRLFVTIRSNGDTLGARLSSGGRDAPPGVSTLRAGPRSAGGHAGDELVLRRVHDRQEDMLLLWRFVGAPHSGEAPAIELRLEANKVTSQRAVLAEWDALVASLRRR